MPETPRQKVARWRKERARRWKQNKDARARIRANTSRVNRLNAAIRRVLAQLQDVPPVVDGGWHPGATRVPYSGGTFNTAYARHPKGVLHSTEGYGLPSYSGSAPHFTLVLTGPGYLKPKLYQHIPLGRSAMALRHTQTMETNRYPVTYQIELGNAFAAKIDQLRTQDYEAIARLMRWIERHGGVPRKTSADWTVPARRLSNDEWARYEGWLAHANVPQNDHWDVGNFAIKRVI